LVVVLVLLHQIVVNLEIMVVLAGVAPQKQVVQAFLDKEIMVELVQTLVVVVALVQRVHPLMVEMV
jgi:hypothetical protein